MNTLRQPLEDKSGINFQFKRQLSYLHPRTSMLMFGPKLAVGNQFQYLYLSPNVSKFVVLTVTDFKGFPFAEMFRVLQYWVFEDIDSSSKHSIDRKDVCNQKATRVQIGLKMHFVKNPSIVRGQIVSGTKDELSKQSKHWNQYINTLL